MIASPSANLPESVLVVSAFRNSPKKQIKRWLEQVCGLSQYYWVAAAAVVGDCRQGDRTYEWLQEGAEHYGVDLDIIEYNHGGPEFGSVVDAERFRCLSQVGNVMLNSALLSDDYVVYVESDLIWDGSTINRLISKLSRSLDADVVAPMIFAGENFYDVWGFRGLDGAQFAPFWPYHSSLPASGHNTLAPVNSVGSCLVMRGSVACDTTVRMEIGALVEWCEKARKAGYSIYVDVAERVEHPV